MSESRQRAGAKPAEKQSEEGTTMSRLGNLIAACTAVAALACASVADAQTFGFAAMQPGTINHTTSSAISKVLKEKGGVNTLVQATAVTIIFVAVAAAYLGALDGVFSLVMDQIL